MKEKQIGERVKQRGNSGPRREAKSEKRKLEYEKEGGKSSWGWDRGEGKGEEGGPRGKKQGRGGRRGAGKYEKKNVEKKKGQNHR